MGNHDRSAGVSATNLRPGVEERPVANHVDPEFRRRAVDFDVTNGPVTRAGSILEPLRGEAKLAGGLLLPVHVVVAVALRPACFSIRRLGRGHGGVR